MAAGALAFRCRATPWSRSSAKPTRRSSRSPAKSPNSRYARWPRPEPAHRRTIVGAEPRARRGEKEMSDASQTPQRPAHWRGTVSRRFLSPSSVAPSRRQPTAQTARWTEDQHVPARQTTRHRVTGIPTEPARSSCSGHPGFQTITANALQPFDEPHRVVGCWPTSIWSCFRHRSWRFYRGRPQGAGGDPRVPKVIPSNKVDP